MNRTELQRERATEKREVWGKRASKKITRVPRSGKLQDDKSKRERRRVRELNIDERRAGKHEVEPIQSNLAINHRLSHARLFGSPACTN